MKSQSQYYLSSFYISPGTYQKLFEYIGKLDSGENPVLAIVGSSGIGKTHFLVSFFEQVLKCQVLVKKNADGLSHATFFKGKRYAIIYDDLVWVSETMTRERMLQLLSGEVTTNSNIKHSSVLVPKDTCRALTSNYSLHNTHEFQIEAKKSNSVLTCFNRRLYEIQVGDLKLHVKDVHLVSASKLKDEELLSIAIKKPKVAS